jgi:ApaG protein
MNTQTKLAFLAFLGHVGPTPFADAFTPTSLLVGPNTAMGRPTGALVAPSAPSNSFSFSLNMSTAGSYLGMDDDDEEDEEDEEDEYELSGSRYSEVRSPFTGLKLDPDDPNPLIKPRPSRYFRKEDIAADRIPDDQLEQTMSADERKENLTVMRQIRKSDLPDLRMRKDHAGWVEANNDLKRRFARDPWFAVNERLRDAIQLGESQEKVDHLLDLVKKLDGAPQDIDMNGKAYAVHTEVYDIPISASRASSMVEEEIRVERAARGRAMMAERRKNEEKEKLQYEEDMQNPGLREDREAKERRERTMSRLMGEIEEDQKKKRERAKEILGKYPETPESRYKAMEKALNAARDDVKQIRRKQLGVGGSTGAASGSGGALSSGEGDDAAGAGLSAKSGGSAARAREAAAAEAAGGRPRLPGDEDVTRGEIDVTVEPASSTETGPLKVEVSSVYNKEQSDPPMRKHCFQYTIKITNSSPTDTIQLLGRRFEIQTVGSSMKDVVQGEGVTGRTPVLKPGEVFEYTSTAPLSVRPIGTTIVAARMKGEYRYEVLTEGQTTATDAQVESGGNEIADLGTFHFIFPEDQRVKPYRAEDNEDEDEDEEDDEDVPAPKSSKASTSASAPEAAKKKETASKSSPSSTLPGDDDMKTGDIALPLNDKSEVVTDKVRVSLTSSYRPERSESSQDKYCFAYNIRITNESDNQIQLVSRRFEIQSVGLPHKDVVSGPGVTGRQPILKPGESFEYTSTAPLNVKPMLDKTPVLARMSGEYNFVILGEDGTTPLSSTPLQAKLGLFHFILPALSAS